MTKAATVPVADAAKQLGYEGKHAGRRLRRMLRARERLTGLQLLVPIGEGEKRPTYHVSMATLRRRCPDLFAQRERDDLAVVGRILERKLVDINDTVDELSANVAAIAESNRRRPR